MKNFSIGRFQPFRLRYLLLVALAVLSLIACRNPSTPTLAATQQNGATPATYAPGTGIAPTSYADVVSRVSPAVVTVRSQIRRRAPQQFPFTSDPFGDLFGDRGGRQQQQSPVERSTGVGSGVIVSQDGYILTNHHVIDGATQIQVVLSDDRTVDAKVVGSDPPSDLALLKINANNLPVLTLGDSDRARVGDVVLAIGDPLDIGKTVTMGIISAKGRQTGISNGTFEDFIQTDAPINQGNSGGALVNTNGELIGINSQILSRSGGSIGIGFAIPSNMARSVMDQLLKGGKVRRGQLGVVVQKVTTEMANSLGLKDVQGVIVSQVQPGSGADKAGLKTGDVITALNDAPINDPNTFRNQIAQTAPGSGIKLTIVRQGQQQQVSATLGEFKDDQASEGQNGGNGDSGDTGTAGKLGISVEPLTPEVASQLGIRGATQGVVVAQVDPSGPAADKGIQQGDVIVQANQQPIRSAADLKAVVDRSGSRPVLLLINRRGTTVFVTVNTR